MRIPVFLVSMGLGLAIAAGAWANCSVIRADCNASYRAALQSCGNSAACKRQARAQYNRCLAQRGC